MSMTNLERLNLEIGGIELTIDESTVYLAENNLDATAPYEPTSAINKRNIYRTALSILESIANRPDLMRVYKSDDISIIDFSTNLQNRIDQLEKKIRQMSINDTNADSSYFMLFRR